MDDEDLDLVIDAIDGSLESLLFTSKRNGQEGANLVDGMFAIADGLNNIAQAIHRLGNADASTPYGGLEALGMQIEKAATIVAGAMDVPDPD